MQYLQALCIIVGTVVIGTLSNPCRLATSTADLKFIINYESRLGSGTFGEVFSGTWTTESGRSLTVAVKRVHFEDSHRDLKNFIKEAQIAKSLSDADSPKHLNFPIFYECVTISRSKSHPHGVGYIVQEKLTNSLENKNFLQNLASQKESGRFAFYYRLMSAVYTARTKDVNLCDVKPANVMIRESAPLHPVLIDFGVASEGLCLTGTPLYEPIESLQGQYWLGHKSSHKSFKIWTSRHDVYSVGAMITDYEALVQFDKRPIEQISKNPKICSYKKDMPSIIECVMDKMMSSSKNLADPSQIAISSKKLTRKQQKLVNKLGTLLGFLLQKDFRRRSSIRQALIGMHYLYLSALESEAKAENDAAKLHGKITADIFPLDKFEETLSLPEELKTYKFQEGPIKDFVESLGYKPLEEDIQKDKPVEESIQKDKAAKEADLVIKPSKASDPKAKLGAKRSLPIAQRNARNVGAAQRNARHVAPAYKPNRVGDKVNRRNKLVLKDHRGNVVVHKKAPRAKDPSFEII